MRQWYYTHGGQKYGPIAEPDLVAMFESGQLTPDTMVWNEGLENWVSARDVIGLVPVTFEPLPLPPNPPASQPQTIVSSGLSTEDSTSVNQPRPWVRMWARSVDIIIWLFLAGLPFFLLFPQADENIFAIIILFLYVFVEAAMLSAWGTTPGKALLKIQLCKCDGSKLSYADALNRAIKVWFRGMAMNIPIATVVTQIVAYCGLEKKGVTSWDEQGAFKVTHQTVGAGRAIIVILIFVAVFALAVFGELATEYGY